jgi:ribosomal-protein-alanine N-acetyltransferase
MSKVRNGAVGDADRICRFKSESVSLNFPDCEFSEPMFRAHLLRQLKVNPETVKVVESGGKVAGYIWFKVINSSVGTFGRIEHIFVDAGFRKKGIGRKLMEAAEEHFKAKGVKKVKLTVTTKNEAAIALYKRIGYETRRFVMEKDL